MDFFLHFRYRVLKHVALVSTIKYNEKIFFFNLISFPTAVCVFVAFPYQSKASLPIHFLTWTLNSIPFLTYCMSSFHSHD